MVFTKNEIMLESTNAADITRIEVACDMMIESFLDGMTEDTYYENAEKTISTIKQKVKSTIEKIVAFIKKCAESVKKALDERKIKKTLSPEGRQFLKSAKAGKIQGIDIIAIYELCQTYEAFCEKFTADLISMMQKYQSSPSDALAVKIKKYIESGEKKTDEILKKAESIASKEITITGEKAIKMLELGLNAPGMYEKMSANITIWGASIQSMCETANDFLPYMKPESYSEAVEDMAAKKDAAVAALKVKGMVVKGKATALKNATVQAAKVALTKFREIVNMACSMLNSFAHKHNKLCRFLLKVLSMSCAIGTVADVGAVVLNVAVGSPLGALASTAHLAAQSNLRSAANKKRAELRSEYKANKAAKKAERKAAKTASTAPTMDEPDGF